VFIEERAHLKLSTRGIRADLFIGAEGFKPAGLKRRENRKTKGLIYLMSFRVIIE